VGRQWILTRGVAIVLALAMDGTHAQGLFAQERMAPFRTSIDLVSLSVTVNNATQHYIGDLQQDDFVVLENGIAQRLTFFAKTDVPLALALLVDSSASMEQALPVAQDAAIGFVRTLDPRDTATIVDFDSRVETAQPFTSNVRALEEAVRRTQAGGATALYNAVYIALKEMRKQGAGDDNQGRRRAIIVLSDGDDTSSLVSFEELLDAVTESDTLIYTIGLGIGQPVGTRVDSAQGAFVLKRLAQQTGGRAFFPKAPKDLASVYAEIRQELSRQYSLAYESNSARRNGEWRRITVRVNRPDVIVRNKLGYFAPNK
jgi:Ca-activated chloride channel homolog